MTETQNKAPNVYELMENDNGEVMVLLYAGEQPPLRPAFMLDEKEACIELYRNPVDTVRIEGLVVETIEKIKTVDILYVCEMKYNENPESENEILFAYPATLKKKDQEEQQQNSQNEPSQQESLSERLRKAREKVLNQAQEKQNK